MRLCFRLAAFAAFVSPLSAADDPVARGKYLVEEVGKCQACHTPLTETGEFDKANWLKGGPLSFAPAKEMKTWHKTAPNITSSSPLFTRWGEKGLVNFLVTGKNPRGGAADPPMPTYTLKQEDAEAIVAYLKSLP